MAKRTSRTTTEPLLAGSILRQQLDLEQRSTADGVMRYRRLSQQAVEREDGASLKPAERLLLHWLDAMVVSVREEKRATKRGEPGVGREFYGPTMLILDTERMAVVAAHQMLSKCMAQPHGVSVIVMAYAIGRACLAELNFDLLNHDRESRKLWRQLEGRIRRILPQHVNWWAKKNLDDPIWSKKVCLHLGTCLMWHLIMVASTRGAEAGETPGAFQPSFHHKRMFKPDGKGTSSLVVMDDEAHAIIADGHAVRQFLHPIYQPMVVEPYPWARDQHGGYLRLRPALVNRTCPAQQLELGEADLTQVHEAVNALNATPWRVNQNVARVIRQIWESGGGMLTIPYADDFPLPPFDKANITDWKHEARAVHVRNKHLKAHRRTFLEKLSVADRMPRRFWYPHYIDFRGRAYPVPAHLHHQGDDVCRGLLEFADGKGRDVSWLAVQACNSWGNGADKLEFSDQYAWVEANGEHILASAKHPLDGDNWWQEAEKPFQFLAACYALADDSGKCHLPIHQDGTCNGLQHYAALGRSAEDAAVVNLVPGAPLADVYTSVAETVTPVVGSDADRGHTQAQLIVDLIDRTVVKQTVMTHVYGVTAVGARKQIYNRLEDAGLDDQEELYRCSFYLARVVMKAMKHVCRGATAIMDWLKLLAMYACTTEIPVHWTTPLGFPVVQPYRNYTTQTIRTVLQAVRHVNEDDSAPLKLSKQAAAFPPNFIHSVDATHMLMVARSCRAQDLAFAAVHDSFWTHAADSDKLARILRNDFVTLHEQPLLDDLLRQFRERYQAGEFCPLFPDPPPRGTYDLNLVKDARYAFK